MLGEKLAGNRVSLMRTPPSPRRTTPPACRPPTVKFVSRVNMTCINQQTGQARALVSQPPPARFLSILRAAASCAGLSRGDGPG